MKFSELAVMQLKQILIDIYPVVTESNINQIKRLIWTAKRDNETCIGVKGGKIVEFDFNATEITNIYLREQNIGEKSEH